MIDKRYSRNFKALSEEDQYKLFDSSVCVVGCGGLGGYIIEILARLGVGKITAVDGDVFDETNLNRQLLSEDALIGKEKALAAETRVAGINPNVKLTPVVKFLTAENGEDIIKGHDIVIDALDSAEARIVLKDICRKLDLIMIHGAIGGWHGQLSVVRPEDEIIEKLYGGGFESDSKELGNPSFIPPVIASLEVTECVKVLLGKGSPLYGKLLAIDLLEEEFEVIDF